MNMLLLTLTAAILISSEKVTAEVGVVVNTMISNVSSSEYETKMAMFLNAVKGSMQESIHTIAIPQRTENQGSGNEVIRFASNAIRGADEHTLRMYVTGSTQVTVYLLDSNGQETEITTQPLATGPRWVGVHLGKHPSDELAVRVSCGPGCQILDAKLNTFTKIRSGERKFFTESYKCSPKKTDAESQCCLRNVNINLREMRISGELEGPTWIDFGYCIGSCPLEFNYANEHARIRHIVERTYNLKSSQDPCLPTEYGSIKVLETTEDDSLVINTWKQFFAKACACF